MSHSFTISIKDDLSSTLKEVEAAIIESGGRFEGNTRAGVFSGKSMLGSVKGEYTSLSDDEVEIRIIKKPFAAPKSKIESAIREYFS